jgi:hypothetical protein
MSSRVPLSRANDCYLPGPPMARGAAPRSYRHALPSCIFRPYQIGHTVKAKKNLCNSGYN